MASALRSHAVSRDCAACRTRSRPRRQSRCSADAASLNWLAGKVRALDRELGAIRLQLRSQHPGAMAGCDFVPMEDATAQIEADIAEINFCPDVSMLCSTCEVGTQTEGMFVEKFDAGSQTVTDMLNFTLVETQAGLAEAACSALWQRAFDEHRRAVLALEETLAALESSTSDAPVAALPQPVFSLEAPLAECDNDLAVLQTMKFQICKQIHLIDEHLYMIAEELADDEEDFSALDALPRRYTTRYFSGSTAETRSISPHHLTFYAGEFTDLSSRELGLYG